MRWQLVTDTQIKTQTDGRTDYLDKILKQCRQIQSETLIIIKLLLQWNNVFSKTMQTSHFKNFDLILLTKISGSESQLQRLFLTQNPKQNSCVTDNYILPHSATIRLVVGGRMSGLRYYNKQACRKWKTMLVKQNNDRNTTQHMMETKLFENQEL